MKDSKFRIRRGKQWVAIPLQDWKKLEHEPPVVDKVYRYGFIRAEKGSGRWYFNNFPDLARELGYRERWTRKAVHRLQELGIGTLRTCARKPNIFQFRNWPYILDGTDRQKTFLDSLAPPPIASTIPHLSTVSQSGSQASQNGSRLPPKLPLRNIPLHVETLPKRHWSAVLTERLTTWVSKKCTPETRMAKGFAIRQSFQRHFFAVISTKLKHFRGIVKVNSRINSLDYKILVSKDTKALSDCPAALKPTLKYFLSQTGRQQISQEELQKIVDLGKKHFPSVIQKEIDEAVQRFKDRGQPLEELTMIYIWDSLRNWSSIQGKKTKPERKPPKQRKEQIDDEAVAKLTSEGQKILKFLQKMPGWVRQDKGDIKFLRNMMILYPNINQIEELLGLRYYLERENIESCDKLRVRNWLKTSTKHNEVERRRY